MKKYIGITCIGIGISYIAYKLLFHSKTPLKDYNLEKFNIDMEEILDDDVLEVINESDDEALVDSDDELDSEPIQRQIQIYEDKVHKKKIGNKESQRLKYIAKKIRENKENLAANITSSKEIFKGMVNEKNIRVEQNKIKTKEQRKDELFYSLFASYVETELQNK